MWFHGYAGSNWFVPISEKCYFAHYSIHVCAFLLLLFVLVVQRLAVYSLSENCLLISLYKSSNLKQTTSHNNFLAWSSSLSVVFMSVQRKQSRGNLNLSFFFYTNWVRFEGKDEFLNWWCWFLWSKCRSLFYWGISKIICRDQVKL